MDKFQKPTRIHKNCTMEEKIDRLEKHLKTEVLEVKVNVSQVKESVLKIENALIGSDYNEHKGIVHLLDSVDKRVKILEEKQILADDKIDTLKWFQRGVVGIIFAYITWLITK